MYVNNLVVFMYVNLHVCLVLIYGLQQTISFNDRKANRVIKKISALVHVGEDNEEFYFKLYMYECMYCIWIGQVFSNHSQDLHVSA